LGFRNSASMISPTFLSARSEKFEGPFLGTT
jgi:hypothetical protein